MYNAWNKCVQVEDIIPGDVKKNNSSYYIIHDMYEEKNISAAKN